MKIDDDDDDNDGVGVGGGGVVVDGGGDKVHYGRRATGE